MHGEDPGEGRGAWEQSCLAFKTKLVSVVKLRQSDFNVILNSWQGYISFIDTHDASIRFPNSPENKFAYLLCFITLCKKSMSIGRVCESKSVQCFFTVWLMDKHSKSLTEVIDEQM